MVIFKKAENISELSDYKRVHIGCIAIYKGQVISVGYNTNKTHPIQKKYNKFRKSDDGEFVVPLPSLHAEMMCLLGIKDMGINFSKVKLYIFRKNLNGEIAMSRPCAACMKAIDDLGIKEIHYTTTGGFAKEIRK